MELKPRLIHCPLGPESGTDTVTFSGSVGGAECQLWDYSYTGTPALDGVNVNAQIDSSTTATATTFTPSPGSNNDISLQQSMVAYTPAGSISLAVLMDHGRLFGLGARR